MNMNAWSARNILDRRGIVPLAYLQELENSPDLRSVAPWDPLGRLPTKEELGNVKVRSTDKRRFKTKGE